MFPNHNILPADEDSWLTKAMNQKLIEFTPNSFCSFYKNFEVLQIQGLETGEYIFGNYHNGKYTGYIYIGNRYTHEEASEVSRCFMPTTIDLLEEYRLKFCEKINYYKFEVDQYAWIFQRALSKV